jgi:hypothetical protein
VTHLTERTYDLLLQGSLPPEDARTVARHLEEACAVCEEFLASRPTADAADGLVERALDALAPAGGRGNDLEFERIERRLRGDGPAPRREPRRSAAAVLAAAVLAAGLAGLVAPRTAHERPVWDGWKGAPARTIPVRLRFVVVRPGSGGAPSLEKGVPGQVVPAAASLQFEIEAGRPAHAALVRISSRGAPEPFWSERVGEGRSPVTLAGGPAAYRLAGLDGAHRFVLLASDEPLDAGRLARAAEALAPPARMTAELPALEGLSLDIVEVEVR